MRFCLRESQNGRRYYSLAITSSACIKAHTITVFTLPNGGLISGELCGYTVYPFNWTDFGPNAIIALDLEIALWLGRPSEAFGTSLIDGFIREKTTANGKAAIRC